MRYQFRPQGVCSRGMTMEIDDNKVIQHVDIIDSCPGNSFALTKLLVGKTTDEAIALLKGIPCGRKSTSCPDQFARFCELVNEELKKGA